MQLVSGEAAAPDGNAIIAPGAGNAKLRRKFSQLLIAAYYFLVKCQSTLVENLSIMYLNWAVKWGLDEEVIHNLFNDCALTSEFYREPLLM